MNNVRPRRFCVDSKIDGPWPGAGPRRNRRMVEFLAGSTERVYLVAFQGGRGTADCVRQATARGIRAVFPRWAGSELELNRSASRRVMLTE